MFHHKNGYTSTTREFVFMCISPSRVNGQRLKTKPICTVYTEEKDLDEESLGKEFKYGTL